MFHTFPWAETGPWGGTRAGKAALGPAAMATVGNTGPRPLRHRPDLKYPVSLWEEKSNLKSKVTI